MRIIRASEIGAYLYCKRAWWYRQRGVEPANQAELAGGRRLHEQHNQQVLAAGCLRVLAYGLLLSALVIFTVYAVQAWLR